MSLLLIIVVFLLTVVLTFVFLNAFHLIFKIDFMSCLYCFFYDKVFE